MATSTPMHPFENPAHALWLVGFGLGFWWIGKLVSLAAVSKGSSLSDAYPGILVLSPMFWRIYGATGKIGQWMGLTVTCLGAVGLVVSTSKLLF